MTEIPSPMTHIHPLGDDGDSAEDGDSADDVGDSPLRRLGFASSTSGIPSSTMGIRSTTPAHVSQRRRVSWDS